MSLENSQAWFFSHATLADLWYFETDDTKLFLTHYARVGQGMLYSRHSGTVLS